MLNPDKKVVPTKLLFKTNTISNATANTSKTLYQPHTAPNIGPFANLSLSSSVPSRNPVNPPPFSTKIYSVPFVATNNSVKHFDGHDHQYSSEKTLHQIDAHMIFFIGQQPLDSVALRQWQRREVAHIQCSLFGNVSYWFLRFQEKYRNDCSGFVSARKKQFLHRKHHITHKVKLTLQRK